MSGRRHEIWRVALYSPAITSRDRCCARAGVSRSRRAVLTGRALLPHELATIIASDPRATTSMRTSPGTIVSFVPTGMHPGCSTRSRTSAHVAEFPHCGYGFSSPDSGRDARCRVDRAARKAEAAASRMAASDRGQFRRNAFEWTLLKPSRST